MPVFGAYETVGQLSPTPFGSVYKAKQAGGSAANFIIKTFSPLGVDASDLKRHPDVKRFLGSAELQKLVASSNGKHWAPVHEMGITHEGAYYVSTFYPTSASRLIKGKTKLGADDFHELTSAVVAGLVELRECCRRSHGNLVPNAILLPRMDATGYGQAMLAEPLAADSTKAASEQGDLAGLGRVLYELVMHKPYNVAGAWPIPDSPEWARMGKRGKGWKEFCNKLLSTDPADVMTLEAAGVELAKLKPKKAPVPMWAVAAAVLVAGIGIGLFSYFHYRPDPNFQNEWVQLVDAYPAWFRMFADDGLRNQLPAEYSATKELVEKAHLELDPRDLSGKRELEEQKSNPPATRDGKAKAKAAFDLAKTVQMQMMGHIGAPAPDDLDPKRLPQALVEKVAGYAKEYEKRGWTEPGKQLAKLVETPPEETGGAFMNRLVRLFGELPALKSIEGDWAVVDTRLKQVTDPSDPILKQFPDYVHRAVYADLGGSSGVMARDVATKVKELRGEFEKDFWPELFQFVTGPWKNQIDRTALGKSRIYETFRTQPSRKLLPVDLQNWLGEARQYAILKEDHPAKSSQFTSLMGAVTKDFDDLKERYERKKEPTPQEIADTFAKRKEEAAKLRELDWRSGTREDVVGRVAEATLRLSELDNDIKGAILATERTDPKNVLGLLVAIRDQPFGSEPAKMRWGQLKTKWGMENPAKLEAALSDPREFDRFKKEEQTAGKNLESMERALSKRLDLSGVVRNSDWNRELAIALKRLDDELQPQRVSEAVNLLDVDRISMPSQTLPLELEKLRANYDEWKEKARGFVADANLLEDHLDAGFGLLGDAKPAVADAYGKIAESGFLDNQSIKGAIAPVMKRYEMLSSLRQESRPATLLEYVRKNDPALVLDAWKRLGSADVNWPATSEDLERERQIRKTLAAVIEGRTKSEQSAALAAQRKDALTKELQEQGPVTWRRFVAGRRSKAEVEAALKKALDSELMKDFGVVDAAKVQPPLSMDVQYDIWVYRNQGRINNLPEKLDDKKAQDEVKALLASLPTGEGADAAFGKIRAGLMELSKDPGSGGGAVLDAGPMSQGAQALIQIPWQRGGTPEQPVFSWDMNSLTFVRLEGAIDANGKKLPPYFLCTTEMTVGLFQKLMGMRNLKATELNLAKGDQLMPGPQLWDRTAADSLRLRKTWLRVPTQLFNFFAPSLADGAQALRQADANPMATMPMQNVSPEAALLMAELLGCRLPTSSEWQFARNKQPMGPNALPNLRDKAWDDQLKHVNALQRDGTIQAQYPDAGMFPYEGKFGAKGDAIPWNAQWHQQFNLNVPAGFNDGYVYLRPVGDGAALTDLVGNVSEMVFDAPAKLAKVEPTAAKLREVLDGSQDQLFVVGGSCMSPPEIGFDRQPCGMHHGYADTGFRLAFEAANRLIVDRLKDLMSEQQYVAVGATSATAN